ncbi:MAG: tol-pal system protein YbgF [Alphaproteobacteria bacterium]
MFRIIVFFLLLSSSVYSNDSLLTIQQQLERLQREVSDLSKTVFSNQNNSSTEESSDLVTNLSAIDMRIYDLEKDVKNLTGSLEDIYFQIEDVLLKLNDFEQIIFSIENKFLENNNIPNENNSNLDREVSVDGDNTLGSLKISSEQDSNLEETNELSKNMNSNQTEEILSPEEQFQTAFDNIRNKNWDEAKNLFIKFIKNNPENQLSGSAHYWLGELYILEKKYRDAALVLAEGYQKFPKSIKSPDMLFKLSESLYLADKAIDACKTLEKLILDFPKNKFVKNAKENIKKYDCLEVNQ